jgi:hypothetical protein
MKKCTVLSLCVVLGLMTGCVAPGVQLVRVAASGNSVTLPQDYAGFTKVEAGSAFRVTINQSEDYSVDIIIDDSLRQHLDVGVQGDTLRIYLRPGVTFSTRPREMRAEITMPALEGLDLSGASRGAVSGFESNDPLRVVLSGASSLQASLSTGDVQLEASGASQANMQGGGDALDLEASGASQANLSEFTVADADVRLSGASQAQINMDGTLNADLSGASKLTYDGDVRLGSVDTSGASTIQQR